MNLPNRRGNLLAAFATEARSPQEQPVRPASSSTKMKMLTEITAKHVLQSSSFLQP